jgi:hypothetical protein
MTAVTQPLAGPAGSHRENDEGDLHMRYRMFTASCYLVLTTVLIISARTGLAQGQGAASQALRRPEFDVVRYNEDWSVLRNETMRTEWLDRLKYIPLGDKEGQYMSLGGEFRGAYERVQNDNWSSQPYGLNSFGLQRFLFHVDAHLRPSFRVFLQLESGIEQGRPGGPRPIDEKRVDFLNAFIELRAWNNPRSPVVRAGKQELQFGAGRVVSVREGPNVRQGFFGVRVDDHLGKWDTTAFAVRPAQDKAGAFDDGPIGSVGFWGAVASRPWQCFEHYQFDSYYFGLDRKAATFNRGTAHEVRQTLGARFAIDPPRETVYRHVVPHVDIEGIYQFGTFGSDSIKAWGVAAEAGLLFPQLRLSPRILLRADTSSGDHNAKEGTLRTYNPLFPTGNYFGLLADTGPGPVNFRDLHPKLVLSPSTRTTITADELILWRASLEDGVYGVPGNLIVPAGGSSARLVGHQPGVEILWQVNSHIYAQADYAVVFAGPFLRESGKTHNLNYTSFSMGYKF